MSALKTYDAARWLYEDEVISWRQAFTAAEQAEFYNCTFLGCAWPRAVTRRWVLEGCRFERCDLSLWRPEGCTFAEVAFADCKLVGVEWSAGGGVRFDVGFRDSDLSFGRFAEMDLRHATFVGCKLREADLSGVDLRGVTLTGTALEGAELSGADLRDADLRDAAIPQLDPERVRLRGARIDVAQALGLARALGLRTD